MTPSTDITPTRSERNEVARTSGGRGAGAAQFPSAGELFDELVPLIGAVPVEGPPVLLVLVPYVLFALTLAGPFLLLVTFALLAACLVALAGALIAASWAVGRVCCVLVPYARRALRALLLRDAALPATSQPVNTHLRGAT